MKIIFFGTSEFAVSSLEAVIKSKHEIKAVVTQPKRQKGRGLKILPSPVEEYAAKQRLRVLEFEDVDSQEAVENIKKENADIFVVVAFGQILSKEALEIPKLYSVNVHASLLPQYRGAAPIRRTIINGDKKTGITIMRMNEFLDKGDIIAKVETEIGEDETALSLSRRLSKIGAELLVNTLDEIEYERVSFIKQNEAKATYAPKLKKEDGLIDWNNEAVAIRNLIRGCNPWPSAYTHLDGKILKILEADISDFKETHKPGAIIEADKKGILIACKDRALLVKRLQLEGKKSLIADEFLRGKPIPENKILL